MNSIVNPSCALEFAEQIQHLRLDRHVHGRNRFVGDDELGLHGEGAGNADALALAAAEVARVALHRVRGQSHHVQQLGDPSRPPGLAHRGGAPSAPPPASAAPSCAG